MALSSIKLHNIFFLYIFFPQLSFFFIDLDNKNTQKIMAKEELVLFDKLSLFIEILGKQRKRSCLTTRSLHQKIKNS